MSRSYFVYILTNKSRTLYVGITNDLHRRLTEHQEKLLPGFTKKYHLTTLIYFEEFNGVYEAIAREKQIKKWARVKKIALIESSNPGWKDVSPQLLTY